MLKRIEDLNFYELLEISHDASAADIHKAYDRVRRVYEPNSIALYSLLSPEETEKIHLRIEEAYRTLVYDETRREYDRMLRERHELPELVPHKPRFQPRPVPLQPLPNLEVRPPVNDNAALKKAAPPETAPAQEPVQPPPTVITEFTGSVIKILREQKGLSLQNVADITKVSSRHLQHIEEEAYDKLPARPYLRGFLTLFAKALGYQPDRLVNDYLRRYEATAGQKPR